MRRQVAAPLLRRTPAARFRELAWLTRAKLCRVRNGSWASIRKKFDRSRNKPVPVPVDHDERHPSLANTISKGRRTMTIRTGIALGISAAVLSLSLTLAPAAFAQDKMGKDDGMKKETMSKDSMKKDTMSKDDGMKKDTMSKDHMKKDDGMMKKN
jgi:pentapeptide MXKDX repeat protein